MTTGYKDLGLVLREFAIRAEAEGRVEHGRVPRHFIVVPLLCHPDDSGVLRDHISTTQGPGVNCVAQVDF